MKKGGKFFIISWYLFVIAYGINLLVAFSLFGKEGIKAVAEFVGSIWGLWFLVKVKELIELEK